MSSQSDGDSSAALVTSPVPSRTISSIVIPFTVSISAEGAVTTLVRFDEETLKRTAPPNDSKEERGWDSIQSGGYSDLERAVLDEFKKKCQKMEMLLSKGRVDAVRQMLAPTGKDETSTGDDEDVPRSDQPLPEDPSCTEAVLDPLSVWEHPDDGDTSSKAEGVAWAVGALAQGCGLIDDQRTVDLIVVRTRKLPSGDDA